MFFVAAADRPDIALFFKGLTPQQRQTMSERIGAYGDSKMATLIGTLLGTFDTNARAVLTKSLIRLGESDPDAVASQLSVAGSLQQLAIANALHAIGPSDLNPVASRFSNVDARQNAIAYLVSVGPSAVKAILPKLNDRDKDVRLAAADALGKLGAKDAIPKLVELYSASGGDERSGYLSAIAGIGDLSTEALLANVSRDELLSAPRRAQAMLGLGRIGSTSAVATLWSMADNDDIQVRHAIISGLQLAGARSLERAPTPELGLEVAAGITSKQADDYISFQLSNPSVRLAAATAAQNRTLVVPALIRVLDSGTDGRIADAVIHALCTTSIGVASLTERKNNPAILGLIERRLRLERAAS